MSRLTAKHVGVALVVCGLVLTLSGVGAFSTVTADRQVFVGVGEKSSSYLAISMYDTKVATNGTNNTENGGMNTAYLSGTQTKTGTKIVLGHVTNYFPATLDSVNVEVTGTSGPLTVYGLDVTHVPLKYKERGNLVAIVDCGGASRATGTVTIAFEIQGTDTYAKGERTVPITCVNENSTQSVVSNSRTSLSASRQVNAGSV